MKINIYSVNKKLRRRNFLRSIFGNWDFKFSNGVITFKNDTHPYICDDTEIKIEINLGELKPAETDAYSSQLPYSLRSENTCKN